jgi:hypothetical protein
MEALHTTKVQYDEQSDTFCRVLYPILNNDQQIEQTKEKSARRPTSEEESETQSSTLSVATTRGSTPQSLRHDRRTISDIARYSAVHQVLSRFF